MSKKYEQQEAQKED
jgi:hypothetical protein